MDEKKCIEKATADAFLSYYNRQKGTSFRVEEYSDAPDVRACDEQEEVLQIDVVQTKDRSDDIKVALGRSESRSLESLRQQVQGARTGKAVPHDLASKLSGNVTDSLKERFRDKLKMRYGRNTALVIRDTSGVDWDWDLVQSFEEIIEAVLMELKLGENPYDRGIWLSAVPRIAFFVSHEVDVLFVGMVSNFFQ